MRPTHPSRNTVFGLLSTLVLAACAVSEPGQRQNDAPFDPYESSNRNVHSFNLAVDRVFFRPASKGYTNLIPDPIEDSFNSFSANLSEPGDAANFLLQGDFKQAGISLGRFLMNSTIGFAGLANPASDFGIPETDTDFGETLAVWGFSEGAYIELPFFGPSTQRDSVGVFVDFFTNPLTFAPARPIENVGFYANVLERLSDRGRYSDTVDSILYQSADSYAVARLIYLQNRRFELEGDSSDSYVDPYADPFSDPYEDPYAQ
ncbi:MlaA family lipoprotein [Sedimentitalea nanhaiensis]|uniref:Phospholipid-binding lipoprotein MlaA n=1 Tax=Sedimentitalea nanhaiensis TaxID=999627 RepID=A0A1I6Z215_9RHOB|nr:VacJ family lipoprotein [Sedimentitalea nanhaiensis]SFT56785.1 phospholipid-binding lipoprotein MlaA [Sedimentitalea nanhaiensis]